MLQRLKVSENKLNFSGTMPATLAQCTQLQLLDLSKNELTSQLPRYLASFNQLRVLSVGYNKLQGDIPSRDHKSHPIASVGFIQQ